MGKTQTIPWDPAEHLETEEDMAAYLNVALEDGDLSLIMATLSDIARAQRMAAIAQEKPGLGRRKSKTRSAGFRRQPGICNFLESGAFPGFPAASYYRITLAVPEAPKTVTCMLAGRLPVVTVRLRRGCTSLTPINCRKASKLPRGSVAPGIW